MTLLGNLIWLLFGGFLSGLGYIIGGLSLCLTIVGIPFGVQSIKLGVATMVPFGRAVTPIDQQPDSLLRLIFNGIWIFFFGWPIALSHLLHGLLLAITIIGLPFAQQHFKLIALALFPFGRDFRPAN
jgi:uncharacterized membrane protein YccF (DUF307 family)